MKERIVVIGAGESGTGAAVLAVKKNYEVFVSDKGSIKENYKNVLLNNAIEFEENGHDSKKILTADWVIKSPGIPETLPLLQLIRNKNIPVISEIEFAKKFTNAFTICITGSNGKTTTSHLIYHILKNAGFNVGLAGNVGNSFAMEVATRNYDYYVLEISSFQLDGMFNFKADIAILLNITPDHLDRYENSFDKYAESKYKILQNQSIHDAFIYCADDEIILKKLYSKNISSQLFSFSLSGEKREGAYLTNNKLHFTIKNKTFTMTLEELALQGKHNIYNSMAAGIAARLVDVRKENIKSCLSDFQNVEHRLEFIANIHGIEFINDSKATNVNSVWYALESMDKPVIWIAGGQDKGNDYTKLRELVKTKVKAIICLGIDNTKIYAAFSDLVKNITETQSMEEAVAFAYHLAESGEKVLLSPACASFDLFENYQERGIQFKQAVKNL